VEIVDNPQNVISTPAPVVAVFQLFGMVIPLKYVFIVAVIVLCVFFIVVPRRRKATWLK